MVDVINSGSSRKRVIGYGRVSTEEQEANYSLDAQKSRFETLCEQNQWESLGFHSETASGTSIRERPVLCQVIQQIKGGGVDALWVKEIDRLTRPENLGDISDIAELLASTDTLLIVDTREANLQED
ncbi:MAG: recombinase family protein, partial [Acidobacteriota bacterium]